jgi:site-specific recombinase
MDIIGQFKIPILLFLLGILVTIFGAWMKIMHMAFADGALTAGLLLNGIAVAAVVWILLRKTK